jgi:hypothetical protein
LRSPFCFPGRTPVWTHAKSLSEAINLSTIHQAPWRPCPRRPGQRRPAREGAHQGA